MKPIHQKRGKQSKILVEMKKITSLFQKANGFLQTENL